MSEYVHGVYGLLGKVCGGCHGEKPQRISFCRGCYHRLPQSIRAALYHRLGDGYEAAYDEAKKFLRGDGHEVAS